MVAPTLKSTVILGYVDVALAGCRTLLGAFDCDQYEVTPWQLRNLENSEINMTKSIVSCVRVSDVAMDGRPVSRTEPLPVAQIYTHKTDDVSLLVISAYMPDGVAHVVADEVVDVVASSNPKEFIVLSSFPTGIETKSFRIIDKGVVVDTFSKLKCGDSFLNSIMQFALVEKLPISVLVSEGRKVRNGTTPNETDGSMQCILALNDSLNTEVHLDLRLVSSFKMMYDGFGGYADETSNLMFL